MNGHAPVTALSLACGLLATACAQIPSPAEQAASEVARLAAGVRLDEPGGREVVVVINDNAGIASHAGLFAGVQLSDPSGTYRATRPMQDKAWSGPSLRDYVAYQLQDGPKVRSYRFTLTPIDFATLTARIDQAGWTLPCFCAASVQDHLAGLGPFSKIEQVWWTSPKRLGEKLGRILAEPGQAGRCEMPGATPC